MTTQMWTNQEWVFKRRIELRRSFAFLISLALIMATSGAATAQETENAEGSISSLDTSHVTTLASSEEASVQGGIVPAGTVFATDYETAGCGGMRNTGGCDVGLTIASVGAGSVSLALLYWHGPTNTTDPAANADVVFAGTPVSGVNLGFSDSNCWLFSNSQSYVADVTHLVSGDGNYTLSGFGSTSVVNTNGASLLVFYDDGDASNDRDIVYFHGNDSNIDNPFDTPGWNVSLSGIDYSSGTAAMELHVADGQAFADDALILNGSVLVSAGFIFQGTSVPGDNNGPTNNGNLWDIREFDVTSFLTPGPNSLSLTTGVLSDCLSLVVAVIDLPAGSAPTTNQPPTADVGDPYAGAEGSEVVFDGSNSSDPDGDSLTYDWDYGDGHTAADAGPTPSHTYADDGTYTVCVTVSDGAATDEDCTTADISNVAPTVGPISISADLVEVGTGVSTNADFTDPGILDTHTATWDWGDGNITAGVVTEADGNGSVTGSHSYTDPGVYTVTLTVTDKNGGSDSEIYEFVVVYDPDGGFVTGGGSIESPEGAYLADALLTGRATFGFVSKYKKGTTTPTGNTEFQFRAAELNFHSSSYEWLVVTGADYAMFKGLGTINGDGEYLFRIWAGDGDPDTFRIKIWTEDEFGVENVVYDNGFDQGLSGGSIVIHTK